MQNSWDEGSSAPNASGAGASPQQLLHEAKEDVRQGAAQLASTAQDKAQEAFAHKRDTATQAIGEFANAIRRAGDDLAEHDQTMVGRVVKQAADGLETLSRSVTDKRPEDLLHTVRDFGRSNPVAFIAGAVMVGFAIGRFARSSGHRQDSARPADGPQAEPTIQTPGAYSAQPPMQAGTGFEAVTGSSLPGDTAGPSQTGSGEGDRRPVMPGDAYTRSAEF